MPNESTEKRKLAAIIPQGGTDIMGYSAQRLWVPLLSNDPLLLNVCS